MSYSRTRIFMIELLILPTTLRREKQVLQLSSIACKSMRVNAGEKVKEWEKEMDGAIMNLILMVTERERETNTNIQV